MTREPLLVDNLLARRRSAFVSPTRLTDALQAHLRTAKRFVLDAQAAGYVGHALHDNPRLVADAHDFAIPPYPMMWIELPFKPFFQSISAGRWDDNGDHRVGYLIAGANVYVASQDKLGRAEWSTMVVKLNQPWTTDQELQFAQEMGVSRLGLDAYFWGTTFERLLAEGDKEGYRVLREHHSVDIMRDRLPPNLDAAGRAGLLATGNGEVRNIIGLLIFLNRTSSMQVVEHVGQVSKVVQRKPTVLLTHSVIRLRIDPLPRLAKLCAGEGVMRRLHDVRGHFCHNKTAKEVKHEHEWKEVEDLLWACPCGGRRWWRSPHQRGHRDLGSVAAEYDVTN